MNQLDAVYNDMLFLESVCKQSPEFVTLLRSPIIKADKKEKVLDAITGGKISTITTTFYKLLLRKEREYHLPEIITAFISQYKAYKNITIVKLTTAEPVGEEVKNTILDKVRSAKNLPQIELDTAVNEELIGGFVLEIGDQMVDSSVAFELNNIRKQFQNNDFIYKIR